MSLPGTVGEYPSGVLVVPRRPRSIGGVADVAIGETVRDLRNNPPALPGKNEPFDAADYLRRLSAAIKPSEQSEGQVA